jgi:hypothetical protein
MVSIILLILFLYKNDELQQILYIYFGDISFIGTTQLASRTFGAYAENTEIIII